VKSSVLHIKKKSKRPILMGVRQDSNEGEI
jgi:hypothetical protein